MKSVAKLTAGLLVLAGIPAVAATMLTAWALSFAHQHVHDRSATILSDTRAIVSVRDYHHNGAAIVGFSGLLALIWVLVAILCVLAGGAMIEARHTSTSG